MFQNCKDLKICPVQLSWFRLSYLWLSVWTNSMIARYLVLLNTAESLNLVSPASWVESFLIMKPYSLFNRTIFRYHIKQNYKDMHHSSAFTRKKPINKRGLTLIAVVFSFCLTVQSCYLNPICPAYAEAEDTEQPAENV